MTECKLKLTAIYAVFLCLILLQACSAVAPVGFNTGKEVRGPEAYYECKETSYCK